MPERATPNAKSFEIAGRSIGRGRPPYVVAELSANHNGDLQRAFDIMAAAKAAGADAVKLQTYTADTMTIRHDGDDFRIQGGLWDGYSLHQLYQEAHTPWDWHEALFDKGRELGITVFSTPFDATAIELLEQLGNPAYKVASFEVTDVALLRRVAATKKPVILSTGMADREEIAAAVRVLRAHGSGELALLHCVSAYPAPVSDINLRTMPHMRDAFDVVVGLSDHTLGTAASVAAVALGASIIEKHFTLRRSDGGHDSAFSLEPDELADLVTGCRAAWDALGNVNYEREASEESNLVFRRSLYVVEDVAEAEPFSERNVRCIRPGHGLAPRHLPRVLEGRAQRDLARGTRLDWSMVTFSADPQPTGE